MNQRAPDLAGQEIGMLHVLRYAGSDRRISRGKKKGGAMWECRCTCGNFQVFSANDLRRSPKDGQAIRCSTCWENRNRSAA